MKLTSILLLFVLLAFTLPVQAQSTPTPYRGMWLTTDEIAALPTTGAAWDAVKAAAGKAGCTPKLSNQDDNCDQYVFAAALVYARTGDTAYRTAVLKALAAVPGTEDKGRTLALARNLLPYVIAADLINLPQADTTIDTAFRGWLDKVRTETLDGRTLISTHEDRPNNWGTHAGASRIAAAIYLGDTADLAKAAAVFRGWTGERASYSGFEYGELDWQCNPSAPVGVNPDGCKVQGVDVGGSLPEEMRRAGTFANPPKMTGYAWEALQGAVAQVWLLERAGYPAASYGDRAILRAVEYLYRIGWQPTGDDTWIPYIINALYDTTFSTTAPTVPGKNIGFADWTHAGATNPGPPAPTSTRKPSTSTPYPTATLPEPTETLQPTSEPPGPVYLICYPADAPQAAVRSTGIDIAAGTPAPRWPLFVAGMAVGGLLAFVVLAWLYEDQS